MGDIRIDTQWRNHPKRKKLRRRLGADAVLALEDLWQWAAENRPDGVLTNMTAEDVAMAVDYPGNMDAFVADLLELRLLDHSDGCLRLHDWADHQPWVVQAPNRSLAAKRAALTRYHKGGKHPEPVDDCPHCAQSMPPASAPHAGTTEEQCPISISNTIPISKPTSKDSLPVKPEVETVDPLEITQLYNSSCGPAGLPKANPPSKTRQSHIRQRSLGGLHTPADWAALFRIVSESPFLTGDNTFGWTADLSWIVRSPENVAKILEGNYSKGRARPGQATAAGRILARIRDRKEVTHGTDIDGQAD